jgi:hypothetical protein
VDDVLEVLERAGQPVDRGYDQGVAGAQVGNPAYDRQLGLIGSGPRARLIEIS